MKKVKSIFAIFLLFGTFAFVSKEAAPGIGLSPGSKAPEISLNDSVNSLFSLKNQKGKYVVLNFWATYDAPSRISNMRLYNAVQGLNNPNISLVSISYDTNKNVYNEIVKLDRLNKDTQFYDKAGEHSAIFKTFRLQKGFTNYLIDPNGVIIAKNLSPNQLTQLVSQ